MGAPEDRKGDVRHVDWNKDGPEDSGSFTSSCCFLRSTSLNEGAGAEAARLANVGVGLAGRSSSWILRAITSSSCSCRCCRDWGKTQALGHGALFRGPAPFTLCHAMQSRAMVFFPASSVGRRVGPLSFQPSKVCADWVMCSLVLVQGMVTVGVIVVSAVCGLVWLWRNINFRN